MPLTITSDDFVICGLGAAPLGSEFPVPTSIDLYSLQPASSGVTESMLKAALAGRPIDRLVSLNADRTSTDLAETELGHPVRNPASQANISLKGLGSLKTLVRAMVPPEMQNVVLLEEDSDLQTQLARPEIQSLAQSRTAQGGSLRVFWFGCASNEADPTSTRIYHNARAVGLLAESYAEKTKSRASDRAAKDALNHARVKPDDTKGSMLAAVSFDASAATQAKPFPGEVPPATDSAPASGLVAPVSSTPDATPPDSSVPTTSAPTAPAPEASSGSDATGSSSIANEGSVGSEAPSVDGASTVATNSVAPSSSSADSTTESGAAEVATTGDSNPPATGTSSGPRDLRLDIGSPELVKSPLDIGPGPEAQPIPGAPLAPPVDSQGASSKSDPPPHAARSSHRAASKHADDSAPPKTA